MNPKVGAALKEARLARELTVDDISGQLHIRAAHLQAIESGDLDRIQSLTQAKGFIRLYANYLELDISEYLKGAGKNQSALTTDSPEEQAAQTTTDQETSHLKLFIEIGKEIHQRREVIGLSKEDIEAHTHIPSHYVDYIENGEFDSFPSPAQARGMLNNYLHFLEINPDELMNRYAEALQIRLSKRREQTTSSEETLLTPPAQPSGLRIPQWVRMFLSPDLILISIVGIIIVGLTIWGIGRVSRTQSEQEPQPTAPSLVEALLPTPTAIPTSTQAPDTSSGGDLLEIENPEGDAPTEVPTVQIAPGSSIEVFIIVRQRTFLRVTLDGETAFEGRTQPGSNLTFSAKDEIRVLTGNAAALQIYFNDQDQGILGIFGEVAELIFTTDGVIRPTKVPTPTQLVTETPTATPLGTPTEEVDLPVEENTPVP